MVTLKMDEQLRAELVSLDSGQEMIDINGRRIDEGSFKIRDYTYIYIRKRFADILNLLYIMRTHDCILSEQLQDRYTRCLWTLFPPEEILRVK